MSYSQRGNNVGIFIGFILFNYTMAVLATYLIFVFKWRKQRRTGLLDIVQHMLGRHVEQFLAAWGMV